MLRTLHIVNLENQLIYISCKICAINQGSPFCNLAIVVLGPLVALEPACQCRRPKRCGFSPWVGKMPWRRAWQPTPVFLPGESHGQRSLVDYSPWGQRVRHDWSNLAHTQQVEVLEKEERKSEPWTVVSCAWPREPLFPLHTPAPTREGCWRRVAQQR